MSATKIAHRIWHPVVARSAGVVGKIAYALKPVHSFRQRAALWKPRLQRRADVRFLIWLSQHSSLAWIPASVNIRGARGVRAADNELDQKLFVPYEHGGAAIGIDGFVLGLDHPDHQLERRCIESVLDLARTQGTAHQTGLALIDASMSKLLPMAQPFDIMVVLDEAITVWSSTVFGVPASVASTTINARLIDVGRAVMNRTVFNVPFVRKFDRGQAARDDAVIAAFRTGVDNIQVHDTGSILEELRKENNEVATRNVIGLIGGATELMLEAALSIIDWALVDQKNWATAHKLATNANSLSGFTDGVASLLSLAPPQYFLIRKPTSCPVGKQHLTLVSLWSKHSLQEPEQFDPIFGIAPHRCLGRSLALDALTHLLYPVFTCVTGTPSHGYRPSDPPINRPTWLTLE